MYSFKYLMVEKIFVKLNMHKHTGVPHSIHLCLLCITIFLNTTISTNFKIYQIQNLIPSLELCTYEKWAVISDVKDITFKLIF